MDLAASHYEGRMLELAGPGKVLPTTADNFPVFDLVLLGEGGRSGKTQSIPSPFLYQTFPGWHCSGVGSVLSCFGGSSFGAPEECGRRRGAVQEGRE